MIRGIHCHTAYQHDLMFHSNYGGDNFGSIFNNTYNLNIRGYGGGNFWTGLGYGLGNAVTRLMGNFMNVTQLWGGYNSTPWMNNLSNLYRGNNDYTPWFSRGTRNGCHCNHSTVSGNSKEKEIETVVQKDKDNDNVKRLENKINDENLTLEDAEKIKEEIDNILSNKKYLDDLNNDGLDKNSYENLKKLIDDKITQLKNTKPKATPTATGNTGAGVSTEETGDRAGANPTATGNTGGAGDTKKLKVSNSDIELTKLTKNQILNGTIDPKDIEKLTPEEAKQLLEKLDVKEGENFNYPLNINALRLLEKAGINVKMAENIDLLNDTNKDAYINGIVSEVSYDEKSGISYIVDCQKYGTLECKYDFKQNGKDSKEVKVEIKDMNNNATYKNSNIKEVIYNYKEDEILKRNGDPYLTHKN